MVIAAIVAVVLLSIIAAFQLALALGAPWGEAAWGGQNPGVLPRGLRIASGIAALVVYPLIMLVVLAGAGLIDDDWLPVDTTVLMWALAVAAGGWRHHERDLTLATGTSLGAGCAGGGDLLRGHRDRLTQTMPLAGQRESIGARWPSEMEPETDDRRAGGSAARHRQRGARGSTR